MKIRTGFVSNSSSSSFVAYGADLEDGCWNAEQFSPEVWKQLCQASKRACKKDGEEFDDEDPDLHYDVVERWADKCKVQHESDDYQRYVAVKYTDMKPGETRREFEEKTKLAVEQFFGKSTKCDTIDAVFQC